MSDSRQEAAAVEQSPQQRQRAGIAGWLMASTFLTSIPAALILHALFSLPEGLFEAAFAIYLIVKGFRPSPILNDARYTGGDGGALGPAAAAP
jgi:hypothetical protein